MLLSKGNDFFENNIFRKIKWSAPLIRNPEELNKYISLLKIKNKKIKDIHSIGGGYFFNKKWIEASVYGMLEGMPEASRVNASVYENIDSNIMFGCSALVAEPIVLTFEDDSTFEFLFSSLSTVRMSCSILNKNMSSSFGISNYDANMLFKNIISKKITDINIETCYTIEDDNGNNYRDPDNKELIKCIHIILDDGCSLSVDSILSHMRITLIEKNGNYHKIPFKQLKKILTI